jgi:hypothetical protein
MAMGTKALATPSEETEETEVTPKASEDDHCKKKDGAYTSDRSTAASTGDAPGSSSLLSESGPSDGTPSEESPMRMLSHAVTPPEADRDTQRKLEFSPVPSPVQKRKTDEACTRPEPRILKPRIEEPPEEPQVQDGWGTDTDEEEAKVRTADTEPPEDSRQTRSVRSLVQAWIQLEGDAESNQTDSSETILDAD